MFRLRQCAGCLTTALRELLLILAVVILAWSPGVASDDVPGSVKEFRVVIMQPQRGAAQKFRPLEDYLKTKGINIRFIGAPDYPTAAMMFANAEADGMFSGSGVAGVMLLKGLARPVVRPVDLHGYSTYWAVILARQGAPEFTGHGEYFQGKRVICCSLASSGEFYVRSFLNGTGKDIEMLTAKSHGAAIAGLHKGAADIAIVKNRVWNSVQDRYPDLVKVGEDDGENPNGTLIVSISANPETVEALSEALLALHEDKGPEAAEVRTEMGVSRYQVTSESDFAHTLALLKKAGVGPDFNFAY